MNLRKMTKSQMIAYTKKYGTWKGVICPSNMYPTRQTMYPVSFFYHSDRGVCVLGASTCEYNESTGNYEHVAMTLDTFLNNWNYYNIDSEQGYYAHYYLDISSDEHKTNMVKE